MRMRIGLLATVNTDSEQTFAVPANVTGVHVVAVGAAGATFSTDIVTESGGAAGS